MRRLGAAFGCGVAGLIPAPSAIQCHHISPRRIFGRRSRSTKERTKNNVRGFTKAQTSQAKLPSATDQHGSTRLKVGEDFRQNSQNRTKFDSENSVHSVQNPFHSCNPWFVQPRSCSFVSIRGYEVSARDGRCVAKFISSFRARAQEHDQILPRWR